MYENEEKSKSPIYLKDIFDSSETLTTLEMKLDNRELIYTDEVKNKTILSFNDLVQEPWYTGSDVQATKNESGYLYHGVGRNWLQNKNLLHQMKDYE